ncbi:MAG: TolC family protein, partial [Deltaproteobacteria bacterium]
VGLANRLDLMNLRGAVMDARRKVEVAANQLQAVVNLAATGNINTKPLGSGINNPFDFRGDQSSFQFGVQFTTPVQLVSQRNAYRAALVGYQQARRNYQRTEDQVKLDCRNNWRNLEFTRRNFETLREQVRAATAQLDIAAEQTAAPAGAPVAAAPGGGGGGGGGAAQGLQIIQAVNSVLNAQNQLIIQWVNYEAFRLDMYNFMGTLEVDSEGYWTDEFYQARARVHRANPNRLYPPLNGDSGYGSPSDAPEIDASTYVQSGPRPAASPQAAQLQIAPEPKEPAGRIRLVAGESPTDPRPGSQGGSERSASSGKEAAGHARVARKPSVVRHEKATAAPEAGQKASPQNRDR